MGVDGRLDWREWEAQDGTKRQASNHRRQVQFLDSRGDGEGGQREFVPAGVAESSADVGTTGTDDDIPF